MVYAASRPVNSASARLSASRTRRVPAGTVSRQSATLSTSACGSASLGRWIVTAEEDEEDEEEEEEEEEEQEEQEGEEEGEPETTLDASGTGYGVKRRTSPTSACAAWVGTSAAGSAAAASQAVRREQRPGGRDGSGSSGCRDANRPSRAATREGARMGTVDRGDDRRGASVARGREAGGGDVKNIARRIVERRVRDGRVRSENV